MRFMNSDSDLARESGQLLDVQPHHRRRRLRQILLVPAVVVGLMTAAVPAGASCVSGPMATTYAGRTTPIATGHANSRSKHPNVNRKRSRPARHVPRALAACGFGRKVG
jgi:hypothetical protein